MTDNETWLHYYDVPSKSQIKVWVFKYTPVGVRKLRLVEKKMIPVFLKSTGILLPVILDTQKPVTAKCYIEQWLPKVVEFHKNVQPNSRMKSWIFRHNNA